MTQPTLPEGVRVIQTAEGARIILPVPARQRPSGFFVALVGLIFAGVSCFMIAVAVQGAASGSGGSGSVFAAVAFALFSLPFLAVGLGAMGFGLLILAGRGEFIIRRDRIQRGLAVGPLRLLKSTPLSQVERFIVDHERTRGRTGEIDRSGGPRLSMVHSGGTKSFLFSYPSRDALAGLAHLLAEHCGLARPDRLSEADRPPVEVHAETEREGLEEEDDADAGDGPVLQPANSRATLQTTPDSVTIHLPPMGLLKGSKGLFVFAIIWLVFCGAIFGIMLGAARGSSGKGNAPLGILIPFALVFVGAGVGMLLASINMGRRHAIIDVVGDALLITLKSPLGGVKSHQWTAAQLERIAVGPSGTTVNHKPVLQLHVRTTDGAKVGLFSERPHDELRWLAATLRERLGLTRAPAPAPGAPADASSGPAEAAF